jgi:diadenosine tetraphosphate (Ap4A) HIT family hydrolase
MKTIEINLTDEAVEMIELSASQLGVKVSDFLTTEIEQHITKSAPEVPKAWMPLERWDELVRGERCPMCHDLKVNKDVNEEGYWVSDLNICRLRLMKNQFVPGYCVLFCLTHVREPYELDPKERAMFFDDMIQTGLALEKVLRPTKMNFEILGNGLPHLHCHIKPRFHGDIAPGIPIDQNAYTVLLKPEEYEERVELIRSAL